MMPKTRPLGLALSVLLTGTASIGSLGCSGADTSSSSWGGSVDTLASGVVQVSNPARGLWSPGEEWRLEEELRIGTRSGGGPDAFERIRDLDVDPLGRIYVLDDRAREVKVFDADGAYLRSLGGPGGGPGEFAQPTAIDWDEAGRLWVLDPINGRFSVFDTSGVHLSDEPRWSSGMAVPWPGYVRNEAERVDVFYGQVNGEPRFALVRFGPDGRGRDTLDLGDPSQRQFEHRFSGGMIAAGIPFYPTPQLAPDGDSAYWAGTPSEYRFARRTFEGDTVLVVEREYDPLPVTEAQKDSALDGLSWFVEQGGTLDRRRLPDVHPAYEGLHPDAEGNVWIHVVTGGPETEYDVFDGSGRYLGRVSAPITIHPYPAPVILDDLFFGVHRDALDVQYLVRLRVEKGG